MRRFLLPRFGIGRQGRRLAVVRQRLQQAALFSFRRIEELGSSDTPEHAAPANVALYATALATTFDATPVAAILAALTGLPDAL